jgi:hypothetical protein
LFDDSFPVTQGQSVYTGNVVLDSITSDTVIRVVFDSGPSIEAGIVSDTWVLASDGNSFVLTVSTFFVATLTIVT